MAKIGVDVKYVHIFRHNRSGIEYSYYRRGGKRLRLKQPIGSQSWLEEIRNIEANWGPKEKAEFGTLGHLIELYQSPKNPAWAELADKTQRSYKLAFDALREARELPLPALSRARIHKLRDEAIYPTRGRWMANYVVTVLGLLLGFAYNRGLIGESPLKERVRRIRKKRGAPIRNRPWTAKERAIVLERAPDHLRLPLALAMCCGLRKTDFLTASLTAIQDGVICVRTAKRDAPVKIPIHPILAEALKRRKKCKATTIAITSRYRPWTENGFNASWSTFRKGLEREGLIAPGLTPHGLRHTLGTLLKEAGLPDGDIADVLGQSGTAMARHYSKEAELPKATREAVMNMDFMGAKKRTPNESGNQSLKTVATRGRDDRSK